MFEIEKYLVDAPAPSQADWNDEGVVILPGILPEELMTAYEQCWLEANSERPNGWPYDVPYMYNPPLKELLTYGPLNIVLRDLLGEPAGVHLNLTGWISTERDWHADSYLNPAHVGDYYAAVWIALDAIHPDSGPFQYVPGSHRWPQVTRDGIGHFVDLNDPMWPKQSETFLTPFFEHVIERNGVPIVNYLPNRGDVLIWHGRLLHRGSRPNVPGMERRACIAHYSGIYHRPDMPYLPEQHGGGWYFPIRQQPR